MKHHNGDGRVDAVDLTVFSAGFGAGEGSSNYDLNGGGRVDGTDLNLFAQECRKSCVGTGANTGEGRGGVQW